MNDSPMYLSCKQVVESGKYPFSMAMLRHYLLHRHKNKLDKAVRKIGKRLFLRSDLLDLWIDEQGSKGGSL
jgi:hypothetical protein